MRSSLKEARFGGLNVEIPRWTNPAPRTLAPLVFCEDRDNEKTSPDDWTTTATSQ